VKKGRKDYEEVLEEKAVLLGQKSPRNRLGYTGSDP
jgi:hypothetical protein